MANANVPNSIQQSTPVSAPPVEQNFRYIEDFLNTQVVHLDGTLPFESFPSGPDGEPSSDRQLANKRYVDRSRPSQLWEVTRTTDSLEAGTSQTDLGIRPRGSFTIPDLLPGQGIRFKVFVPLIEVINKGGWPTEAAAIEYRLRLTNSTFSQNNGDYLLRAHTHVPAGVAIFNRSAPPIYAERTFWDVSKLGSPGNTIYFKSFGVLGPGFGNGAFKFIGDDERPWQISVEVVG